MQASPMRDTRQRNAGRARIDDAKRYIETHFPDRLTLEELAGQVGLSVFRFATVFRRQVGVSPYRYLSLVRVRAAQSLLLEGIPPAIVAIEVGFCDQSHLCRHFRSLCGQTPRQFMAGTLDAPTHHKQGLNS